jgi:hypothetical protein
MHKKSGKEDGGGSPIEETSSLISDKPHADKTAVILAGHQPTPDRSRRIRTKTSLYQRGPACGRNYPEIAIIGGLEMA